MEHPAHDISRRVARAGVHIGDDIVHLRKSAGLVVHPVIPAVHYFRAPAVPLEKHLPEEPGLVAAQGRPAQLLARYGTERVRHAVNEGIIA